MTEDLTPLANQPKNADKPQWWKRLLTAADKDPSKVLRDPRCRRPDFCEAFLDLCDGKALEAPTESLRFAKNGAELGERIGDPHLIHRGQGVTVHAHISRGEWDEAHKVLAGYAARATGCCKTCRSDYYRRRADLLIETGWAEGAATDLLRALEEIAPELDEDTLARIRFLRGIVYHFQHDKAAALKDAGQALMELSFESPRGYFMDTLAFVGCFLAGDDTSQDARALDYLLRFKERIQGLRGKGWDAVRTRLAWVEGAVYARLGDKRRAGDRLESVRLSLLEHGPEKHAAAVSIDLMQLLARTPSETNVRAMRRIVGRSLGLSGLDKNVRQRLKKIEDMLVSEPEKAPQVLARQRAAIITPVPGLV